MELATQWTQSWPASATKQKWILSKVSRKSLRFYIICVNIIMTHRSVARQEFSSGEGSLFPVRPFLPSLSVFSILVVPQHRRSNSRRAFSAAGPTVWNSLPDYLRDPTRRTALKIYLFATYALCIRSV